MKLRLKELGLLEIDRARVNPNFDRQVVSRLIRNHGNAVKAQADVALKNSQREVDAMRVVTEADLLSVDSGKAKLVSAKMRREIEALAGEKPPLAEASRGHNPNLFPPFWDGGHFGVVGGAVSTPIFRRRPEIGLLSISVAAFLPGGHIDRGASMGALTVAPSEEIVTASVSTFVGGTIAALSILGYGRASARLTISISADGASGFSSAFGSVPIGDTAFGVTRLSLTNMSASVRLLVRAGDLVLITAGLRVTAGCGGLICSATSNIAMSGTVMCLT